MLSAMTFSYLRCLRGIAFPIAIGSQYTGPRAWVAVSNPAGNLILALFSVWKFRRKVLDAVACIWLAAICQLALAVSFVV